MKATAILMEEHQVIEQVITALETGVDQLEQGLPIRPEFFSEAATFFKGFADGCHHKKEEGVLFDAMIAWGAPNQGGPIQVMLAEHVLGRSYTLGLYKSAHRLAKGEEGARQDVIYFARSHAGLLRQHIQKENRILFPMANQIIPPGFHEQILQDFEKIEHEETGQGVHEKYLAMAEALEKETASLMPAGGDW